MKSMTGFGTGEAALGTGKLVLDARSVNHRYLDVRVRLPQEIVDQSLFLEQRARERLSRGRFELNVRYEGPTLVPRLDADRVRSVFRELERLRDELSPGSEVPLAAIMGMPELYVAPLGFDVMAAQQALGAALDAAIAKLDEMRLCEGQVLRNEIASRLAICRGHQAAVRERVPNAVRAAEARLRTRVIKFLHGRRSGSRNRPTRNGNRALGRPNGRDGGARAARKPFRPTRDPSRRHRAVR